MMRFLPARRVAAAACILAFGATMAVGATMIAGPASAHGAVSDPPSRIYGCWERWHSNHTDPAMQTADPMCANAWQTNPNAMWNWNGLFREGVAGRHEQVIPDGKLCSADKAGYEAADVPGAWRAAPKAHNFTLTLTDPSNHGADYLKIYVTKQGFDSTTQTLKWSDLELVKTTGRFTQAPYVTDVSIPTNRTGRHIVYTVWQASHLDQSYYACSDVQLGGTTPSPTPTVTPTPSPTPIEGGCSATYTKASEWAGGFNGDVTVKAGNSAIRGWKVALTWPNGQRVTNAWNAAATTSGTTTTASNLNYNGALAASASTSFGFSGSWTGTNGAPTVTCTAS